jgi:hypothetical protein
MQRVLVRLAVALIFGATLFPVVAVAGSAATRDIEVYRAHRAAAAVPGSVTCLHTRTR